MQGRATAALSCVDKAHQLAREHGDVDTEALALSRRAALLLRLGRVEEATADVDEAMLLVHRDLTGPFYGAMIYCNTIDFCRNLGDFERAFEWTEAASRWINQRQVCGFPGVCRVHRAELLRLQGEHLQAEAEVRAALSLFERHRFRWAKGFALSELGLQHLEMGALARAREAFDQAAELGHEPLPGAAELALRHGDASAARAMLETALQERADNPLGRTRLLPTLVCACLELGDTEAARAAATELGDAARKIGTVGLQAQAETAFARIHLAANEHDKAVRAARSATRAWNLIGACYELAQTRQLLAQAYDASGDPHRARVERQRAQEVDSQLSSAATVLAADTHQSLADASDGPSKLQPIAEQLPVREGTTLDGKIAIGPVLGIGGMGIVHAGKHLVTGRDVAVKVLQRRACGASSNCKRLLQEARACGQFRHPNVVDIYDAGMHGNEPYIVMELLVGRSLDQRLDDAEPPSLSEVLNVGAQAARGVAAAHAAGVIHRDLKPGNIFVTESGIKVLDFGISKQAEGAETKPGSLVGTPFYMAPEQIAQPESVDERTDVYALGAVLFELLTGEPPFVADSVQALLYDIVHGPQPVLRAEGLDVPADLEALVLRALARDPAQRFASATELATSLEQLRH